MSMFHVIEEKQLLIITCPQELDYAYTSGVLSKIYFEKEGKYSSYNSFIDLSVLEKNNLNIKAYTESVKIFLSLKPKDIPVKIALLVRPEFLDEFTTVYSVVSEFENISLLVTGAPDECASFLNTGLSCLMGSG